MNLLGLWFNFDDQVSGGALGSLDRVNFLDGSRDGRVDDHLHFHGRQHEHRLLLCDLKNSAVSLCIIALFKRGRRKSREHYVCGRAAINPSVFVYRQFPFAYVFCSRFA